MQRSQTTTPINNRLTSIALTMRDMAFAISPRHGL